MCDDRAVNEKCCPIDCFRRARSTAPVRVHYCSLSLLSATGLFGGEEPFPHVSRNATLHILGRAAVSLSTPGRAAVSNCPRASNAPGRAPFPGTVPHTRCKPTRGQFHTREGVVRCKLGPGGSHDSVNRRSPFVRTDHRRSRIPRHTTRIISPDCHRPPRGTISTEDPLSTSPAPLDLISRDVPGATKNLLHRRSFFSH